MRRHWHYLKYVLCHKWFVFWAGIKLGPPQYWQYPLWIATLILHDWDKFLPNEWFAYQRRYFNAGDYQQQIDTALDDLQYQMAWHLHQKRNKHHWQWWITPKDDGTFRVLPMSEYYICEMIADWYGAGRVIVGKNSNTTGWYQENRDKIILHSDTRKLVERFLER